MPKQPKVKTPAPLFDPENLVPGARIPRTGLTVIAELPFTQLADFQDHHRLRVFAAGNCQCVDCGREGTRFVEGMVKGRKDGYEHHHRDVYTQDMVMLVTHLRPEVGFVGKKDAAPLEAIEVLCAPCHSLRQRKTDEK